jgi:hypothetical protein
VRARASEVLISGTAVSATEEGRALTGRTQRQGVQALTGGSGREACVREAVSRDLGRAIVIRHGRSKPGRG